MAHRARHVHPDNEIDFFLSIPRLVAECNPHIQTFDLNIAEYYKFTVDEYGRIVHSMSLALVSDNGQGDTLLSDLLDVLLVHLLVVREKFHNRVLFLQGQQQQQSGQQGSVETPRIGRNAGIQSSVSGNVLPGRPYIDICPKQVQHLWEMGFKWSAIAKMLGVSERTLRNRRQELSFNLQCNLEYSTISDDDLDTQLMAIMEVTERSGETFMIGALRSRGKWCNCWGGSVGGLSLTITSLPTNLETWYPVIEASSLRTFSYSVDMANVLQTTFSNAFD